MLATISLPTAAPAAEDASAEPAAAPAEETLAPAPVEKPPVVDYQDVPAFGGPNSAGAQLRSDSAALEPRKGNVLLRPYYAFKGWLNGQAGLAFGADYAFMWQYGAPSLDERTGAGGVFRFYGNWALLGRGTKDTGSLAWKVESRQGYTTVAPQALAGELGYAGLTATTFSDAGFRLTNLYWHQSLLTNRLAFTLGFVDTTDYVNVYGLVNPWTDFSNYAFGNDETIAFPSQGLGLAVRVSLTNRLAVLAGLADANGDPGDPFQGFDTSVNEHQLFEHVAVGWRLDPEREVQSNVQVTGWRSDERPQVNVPRGQGLALTASYLFGERWLPFLRVGYSDGGAGAILERSASAGAGYYLRSKAELIGFAVNVGRPSEKTYGQAPRDQLTLEAFYRLKLLQHLAVTPDLQLIVHPARQPGADAVVVLGVRARMVM